MTWTLQDYRNLFQIIAAIATVIAAGVAVWGITAWRRQHIGIGRMRLATTWLCLTYEIADAIEAIRSPLMTEGEYVSREQSNDETFPESTDVGYAIFKRCQHASKLFNRYRVLRYRIKVRFDDEACRPLEELLGIRRRIIINARMLANAKHAEMVKKAEAVVTEGDPETDTIPKQVAAAVDAIEKICSPILLRQPRK